MPRGSRLVLTFAVVLCAIALTRCGSGTTDLLTPSPSTGRCGVALKTGNTQIAASGGSGTISIEVERECQWTIKAGAGWLSFGSVTAGQGPADVSFNVQPNRSTSARTQEVAVSDQRIVIRQDAAVCAFAVDPDSIAFDANGGSAHASVQTEDFCSWSISTSTPWLTIEGGANRTGAGDVEIRSSANSATGARSGSVQIAGTQVAVSQAAASVVPVPPVPSPTPSPSPAPTPSPGPAPSPQCTYTANPPRFDNLTPAASIVQVNVTTQSSCTWTASSPVAWVTLNSGSKGSGNGVVELSVKANTGAARATTLTIAGLSVPLSQRGVCAFSLAPSSFNPPATGGTVQVAIATDPGCSWSVAGLPSWTRATPASGSGPLTISLAVDPNTGAARTATFTIAGENFQISQAAAPCTYTVAPTTIDVNDMAQTKTVSVTTQSHCTVNATSSVSWVEVKSAPNTGSGTITLDIKRNQGSARTGTVTVTGQSFSTGVTINQQKGN